MTSLEFADFVCRNNMGDREFGLTDDMRNRVLGGVQYSVVERQEIYEKFVHRFLKINEEDPENFSKVAIHFNTLPKKKKEKHHLKKLGYRKRKELGLYTLGRKSLSYKNVLPLHRLWLEYMKSFLNLEELREQNWKNSPEDPNFEAVSLKLFRADYHGALMTVLKSSCPNYVAVSGIVVMETKNCFKLLGDNNIVKTIPKPSSVFTFKIENFQFTFLGKNFQVKPAERSSKKIKTVYTSDLQF